VFRSDAIAVERGARGALCAKCGALVMPVELLREAHVLRLAREIRLAFGAGGVTFPGAAELYRAANIIEAWAAAHADRPQDAPSKEEQ